MHIAFDHGREHMQRCSQVCTLRQSQCPAAKGRLSSFSWVEHLPQAQKPDLLNQIWRLTGMPGRYEMYRMDCCLLAQQPRLPTHGLTNPVSSLGSAMPTDTTTSAGHTAASTSSPSSCRVTESKHREQAALTGASGDGPSFPLSRVMSIWDWRAHQGPRAQTGWCV